MEERLQKIIAAAGLCSRRKAEELIAQGLVTVNGTVAGLGDQADIDCDTIYVKGIPLSEEKPEQVYLMLNKPRGYTCSMSDPHAQHLVTELVSGCGGRVYPVGRLDVDSQGLLLLTNDGAFAHTVLHPSHQVEKTYHVTVTGFREDTLERLRKIRQLDEERIAPARVRMIEDTGSTVVLEFVIHEGKKRQIRRMCAKVGLSVRRLCRVAECGVLLGDLPEGKWRYLTREEIALLYGKTGEK